MKNQNQISMNIKKEQQRIIQINESADSMPRLKTKKIIRVITVSVIAWSAINAILKGWLAMHAWGITPWLMTYEWGFVKRGMWGTIIAPLLAFRPDGFSIPEFIQILSWPVLLMSLFTLGFITSRISQKNPGPLPLLIALVFFSSPYITMTANTMGYLDQVIIIIAFISITLVLKGYPFAAGLLTAFGVLCHEAALVTALPIVLMAVISRYWLSKPAPPGIWSKIAYTATPSLIAFSATFIWTVLYPTPDSTWDALKTKLITQGELNTSSATAVIVLLKTSFIAYLQDEGAKFPSRILDIEYAMLFYTFTAIIGTTIWKGAINNRTTTTVLALACGSTALLLHCIAFDTPRIWCMPMPYIIMTLWILTETNNIKIPQNTATLASSCLVLLTVYIMAEPILLEPTQTTIYQSDVLASFSPALILAIILTGACHREQQRPE